MENVLVGSKLYHWCYGVMTVINASKYYVELSFDDPTKMVSNIASQFGEKPRPKKFLISSIGHWIHEVAINALDNNNEFDYPGYPEYKGMILPIEGKEFHIGLKSIILADLNELKVVVQFSNEYMKKTQTLAEDKKDLVKCKNNLETVKTKEADYKDRVVYHEAITAADVLVTQAALKVEHLEKDIHKHADKLDEMTKKFNFTSRDKIASESEAKLDLLTQKVKVIL